VLCALQPGSFQKAITGRATSVSASAPGYPAAVPQPERVHARWCYGPARHSLRCAAWPSRTRTAQSRWQPRCRSGVAAASWRPAREATGAPCLCPGCTGLSGWSMGCLPHSLRRSRPGVIRQSMRDLEDTQVAWPIDGRPVNLSEIGQSGFEIRNECRDTPAQEELPQLHHLAPNTADRALWSRRSPETRDPGCSVGEGDGDYRGGRDRPDQPRRDGTVDLPHQGRAGRLPDNGRGRARRTCR